MTKSIGRKYLMFPLAVAVMGAGGCSSVESPIAAVSQAQLALRQAEQSKASQHAPLELRKARDKLTEAEQAMRNEEYLKARRLSEQALADARLAEVKAESEIARQNAAELQEIIKTLRLETERGSSR
jgi:hypothetical protein